MKKYAKLIATVLCAALLLSCLAPAALAMGVTKDENIYVELDADGRVTQQTVSVHLHSDTGVAGVTDVSNLTDLKDLKDPAAPEVNGSNVVWNVHGQDVYYSGLSSDTPPITASVTYTLDGQPISAQDVTGQSGALTITVTLTNNTGSPANVNGKQRTVYTPFVTAVGMDLPTDTYSNVTAEHGTVQADGTNQVVAFVCLPGMWDCLGDLLPDDFQDLKDKLLDTVTVSANVTNCQLPSVMIGCATSADVLEGDADFSKFDDLLDDLDELEDATFDLMDGTQELYDGVNDDLVSGVNDLRDGTGDLKDGTQKLRDKVNGELTDGVNDLNDGAIKLDDNFKTLDDGLNTLTEQNDTLNNGMAQAYTGLLTLFDSILAQQLGQDPGLTADNYAAVFSGLGIGAATQALTAVSGNPLSVPQVAGVLGTAMSGAPAAQVYGAMKAKLPAAIQADEQASALVITMACLSVANGTAAASLEEEDPFAVTVPEEIPEETDAADEIEEIENADALAGAEDTQEPDNTADPADKPDGTDHAAEPGTAPETEANPGADPAANPETNPENNPETSPEADPETNAGPAEQREFGSDTENDVPVTAGQEMRSGLAMQVALLGMRQSFSAAPMAAASAAEKLETALTQSALIVSMYQLLDGMNTLKGGVAQYTAGVTTAKDGADKLKTEGTEKLREGTQKLHDKMPDLRDGVGELDDGAGELNDAVCGDLTDGVNDLLDGARELNDGMHDYWTDGISKLTESEDIDKLTDLKEMAQSIKDATKSYIGYSGSPEGVTNTVKFVMKTTVPTYEEAEEVDAPAAAKASGMQGFLQRIKDLF